MDKIRVIFFGNEKLATGVDTNCPTFRMLLTLPDIEVVGLVIKKSARARVDEQIEVIAKENGVDVYPFVSTEDCVGLVDELGADLGVLAAFGKMVRQDLIDAFRFGILNIHPSLLPKYRGTTPVESAILNGDRESGVSIMLLDSGMDTGPIVAQEKLILKGDESKQWLSDGLGLRGSRLLERAIEDIVSEGRVRCVDQAGSPTLTKRIEKEDGFINFDLKSAEVIEREIRAYAGWPKSSLKVNTKKSELMCVIEEAHLIAEPLAFDTKGVFASDGRLILGVGRGI